MIKSLQKRGGFTLIELLVVISIISLLSSIILAALSGARNKGRIAGALLFAENNYQTQGANAIGYWNFNEGSKPLSISVTGSDGNLAAIDLSGHNRTMVSGLAPGTSPVNRVNNTPTGSGYALSFSDSQKDWAQAPNLSGSDLMPNNITASAWVYLTAANNVFNSLVLTSTDSAGDDPPIVLFTGVSPVSGNELPSMCSSRMPNMNIDFNIDIDGKWHQVTCTVSSSWTAGTETGTETVYYDGKKIGSQQVTGSFNVYSQGPISVITAGGGVYSAIPSFSGYVDDVAIYGSALTANQIHEIYAMEAPEHMLAQNTDKH